VSGGDNRNQQDDQAETHSITLNPDFTNSSVFNSKHTDERNTRFTDSSSRSSTFQDQDEFGGSWFDDFEDGNGVKWSESIVFNDDNSVSPEQSLLKKIAISVGGSDRILNDYQLKIGVPYNSDMKPDFDDVQFYDSDMVTEIAYWRESFTVNTSAIFWVKVPTIPISGTTIFMAYDDDEHPTTSNGEDTFDFFDDFDGANINSNKWSINSVNTIQSTVSGGKIRITDATNTWVQDNTDTGSQHQAKWNPIDRFILEWEQEVSDTHLSQMGEVGIVSTKLSLINSLNHWSYRLPEAFKPNGHYQCALPIFEISYIAHKNSKMSDLPNYNIYQVTSSLHHKAKKISFENELRPLIYLTPSIFPDENILIPGYTIESDLKIVFV
jgi:hypothetical protein